MAKVKKSKEELEQEKKEKALKKNLIMLKKHLTCMPLLLSLLQP